MGNFEASSASKVKVPPALPLAFLAMVLNWSAGMRSPTFTGSFSPLTVVLSTPVLSVPAGFTSMAVIRMKAGFCASFSPLKSVSGRVMLPPCPTLWGPSPPMYRGGSWCS